VELHRDAGLRRDGESVQTRNLEKVHLSRIEFRAGSAPGFIAGC
jgi:hypothetical protein